MYVCMYVCIMYVCIYIVHAYISVSGFFCNALNLESNFIFLSI